MLKLLLVAFVVATAVLFVAFVSYRPAESAGIKESQAPGNSQQHQQSSADKKPQSVSVSPEERQRESSKPTNTHEEQSASFRRPDRLPLALVLGTWALVIVSIVNAWIMAGKAQAANNLTARSIRQERMDAHIVRAQTEKSIEVARDTARQQLRAYLFCTGSALTCDTVPEGRKTTGTVKVKNFGVTPASHLLIWTWFTVLDVNAPPPTPLVRKKKDIVGDLPRKLPLPPGADVVMPFVDRALHQEELDGLQAGTKRIHLQVTIQYVNAFRKECHTFFCAYRVKSAQRATDWNSGPFVAEGHNHWD